MSFYRTKSVTQTIRGFIERLLRAAQRVLGSRMRLSDHDLASLIVGNIMLVFL